MCSMHQCADRYTVVVTVAYSELPVSDPRFKPRSFTLDPRGFGKVAQLRWREAGEAGEETQVITAQVQHEFAYAITEAVTRSPHRTVKAYAKATGTDYQRLTKILRGDVIMRLEDIADAHRHLGIPLPKPATGEP